MRKRKLEVLAAVLAGALALGAAACKKTETTTVATAPAGETVTTTTTTTTTTAELVPPADAAVVTADPVVVSQRNATRRRAAATRTSARTGQPEERAPAQQPARSARVVPEGTILRVAFEEPISTATAKEGDKIRGRVLDDVLDTQGRVAIASGSSVVGTIEHAVDSGRLARAAELRMRLTDLETSRGMVPIRTSVYDRVGKTHTKRNVGYIAGGAAVGAIVGQVLGKDTESTLKGAAAGAAVGTGVAAATGERDITIEPGRTVAFTLEEEVWV